MKQAKNHSKALITLSEKLTSCLYIKKEIKTTKKIEQKVSIQITKSHLTRNSQAKKRNYFLRELRKEGLKIEFANLAYMKAEQTDGDTATDRKYVQDWVQFKNR